MNSLQFEFLFSKDLSAKVLFP